jgi:aspartyl-tRNA(Asn)/glutamyl-tRNA(Gln) amidotransferase subunit A
VLDHVGPLTRTVEDNAMLLGAIAGHDSADRSSTTRPLADCLENLHAGVKGLRIGVIAHFYTEDLIGSPEQVAAITTAADVLRRLGADVQPVACHRSRAGLTAGAPFSSPRPMLCMSATSSSGRRITLR